MVTSRFFDRYDVISYHLFLLLHLVSIGLIQTRSFQLLRLSHRNPHVSKKRKSQDQTNDIALSPAVPISTTSTIEVLVSPSVQALCTPSRNFKSPNSLQDQLTLMAKQLSKITVAIENMHVERTRTASSTSAPADENQSLFESITCTDDLFMMKCLDIHIPLDTITCTPCFTWKRQPPKNLSIAIRSSFGVFQYVAQNMNDPLSQRFHSLKTNFKSHFSNKLHIWCVHEEEERRQAFEDFLRKNEKAGLNVDRAALFAIRSGLTFVDTLNLLDLSGTIVGTYRN